MFSNLSDELQWIAALMFVLIREMTRYAQHRLIYRAAGSNTRTAKRFVNMQIGITYTSFVVILIGSKANKLTSYCLLGTDFTLNLILCIKIIRIHKKVCPTETEVLNNRRRMEDMVSELMINETTEFITPASFIITFVIAYHGPNALIIGGLRNELWQYEKVEDVLLYLTGAFQMILVDTTSAIISFISLKIFCNINVFREYIKIIKECGLFMTILLALRTNLVGKYD